LSETFKEVITKQGREATIAKDTIYSVLGLFEFGKAVDFKYKPRLCEKCSGGVEKSIDCHDEKYKKHDPYYT